MIPDSSVPFYFCHVPSLAVSSVNFLLSAIQKNLKAISRGRTVLIISHRLSIVSHADNIVVIDSGTLSDIGNHKELLSRDGIYKEFWTQQMRGDA